MSTLLKWAQNTQGKITNKNNGQNGEKKWIHPPDTLQKGHIAYLVKFLGNTIVDQPKGIDVVKEAILKLKFSQQLKKSESGAKPKKVELTVSIDGVAIQEPRSHNIMHQFPLHRISYCADDKGEKRFFSFIAKQSNPNDNTPEQEEKHECFVFISDKLAEEITLTIGQAFELAYKRFLETSGRDLEAQRRAMLVQQKIKRLEQENNIYKQRLLEITQFNNIKQELDGYLRRHEIKNILEVPHLTTSSSSITSSYTSSTTNTYNTNGTNINNTHSTSNTSTNGTTKHLLDFDETENNVNGNAPPVPPRHFENAPTVGTKLEGLLLNEIEQDDDFDPRSYETNENISQNFLNGNSVSPPLLAPPPKAPRRGNLNNNDSPTKSFGQDLFGSGPFQPNSQNLVQIGQNGGQIGGQNGGQNNGQNGGHNGGQNHGQNQGQNHGQNNGQSSTSQSNNLSLNLNQNNIGLNMVQNNSINSPSSAKILDPFEMGDFGTAATSQDLENAIGLLDKRILEMKTGFSRGISFGNDDFSLESLDPLKN